MSGENRNEQLKNDLSSAHRAVSAAQRRLLEVVVECDRAESWRADGCRDLAQWLSQQLGISNWAARRWINAAHTLPHLPRLDAAFCDGTLGLDKTLELCRFATPQTEKKLITWARRVTPAGVRHRADRELRAEIEDVREADRTRYLNYWYFDDGRRFGIDASLPAAEGAVVAKALGKLADSLPEVEPGEHDGDWAGLIESRRADALVALATQAVGGGQDAPLVVVHVETSTDGPTPAEPTLEDGPVIHPEVAHRLLCDARVEVVAKKGGKPFGIGRTSRNVPRWLMRQLKHRDGNCCTFPGCEMKRFLHAHHIRHWAAGGATDLDNLVLVCTFHHKLVHEYGWGVDLAPDGTARWIRPDGRRSLERGPPELVLS